MDYEPQRYTSGVGSGGGAEESGAAGRAAIRRVRVALGPGLLPHPYLVAEVLVGLAKDTTVY